MSSRLGLPISDDTLLRRVKQAARTRPPLERIPALGADDWAWRKRSGRYGTILVDLNKRRVADLLLPECSASAVEQWLRQHPGVKISVGTVKGRWHTEDGAERRQPTRWRIAFT